MYQERRAPAAQRLAAALVVGAAFMLMPGAAQAQDVIRIALPTKNYFPTVITEAAIRQKLFDKEGIKVEAIIFRGSGPSLEAVAAGAADITVAAPALVAAAVNKGVGMQVVATAARRYLGLYLMVKADSPINKVQDLAGKKVGITSTGSASEFLALWAGERYKTEFTRVPVGGGGLTPNLNAGNVDAIVGYAPPSFELVLVKQARILVDYSEEVPPHLVLAWTVATKIATEKPEVVQKALNALYGGLNWLRQNRAAALELVAEVDEIKPDVAVKEYEETIMKLETNASVSKEETQVSLDLGRKIGITNTAPVDKIINAQFKPVPTK